LATALLATAVRVPPAIAQAPRPGESPRKFFVPFSDPQQFFEQFFGGETEQQRQALANVPVSPQEESQYGSRAAKAYLDELQRRNIDVQRKGKDVEYLHRLVETLRPRMRNAQRYPRIQVLLAEVDWTDARSCPGGTLFIDRGMIDYAGSEATLVGILGHELSHLDHGHQLHVIRRIKLSRQTFSGNLPQSPEKFFQNGMMLMKAFMRPFRPEDEAEADRDGARWTYELGYDPQELASMFLRMHERGPGLRDVMPEFLQSHPDYLRRRENVQRIYEELQGDRPKDDLYVGQENLRRRITRAERRFPE
jgi:predicted Zn-dependent protease